MYIQHPAMESVGPHQIGMVIVVWYVDLTNTSATQVSDCGLWL